MKQAISNPQQLLGHAEKWQYLTEGKNHIVYHDGENKYVLRVRKSTNKNYYNDTMLMRETEYNQLFENNVIFKSKLRPFVDGHTQIVPVKKEFLQNLNSLQNKTRAEVLIKKGKIAKIDDLNEEQAAPDLLIDYEYPCAYLMINLTAKHDKNTFSFEIKPKSQAVDPVNPEIKAKAEQIFKNQVSKQSVFSEENKFQSKLSRFIEDEPSKFEIVQVSRKNTVYLEYEPKLLFSEDTFKEAIFQLLQVPNEYFSIWPHPDNSQQSESDLFTKTHLIHIAQEILFKTGILPEI